MQISVAIAHAIAHHKVIIAKALLADKQFEFLLWQKKNIVPIIETFGEDEKVVELRSGFDTFSDDEKKEVDFQIGKIANERKTEVPDIFFTKNDFDPSADAEHKVIVFDLFTVE